MYELYAKNKQGCTVVYRGETEQQVRSQFKRDYQVKGWTVSVIESVYDDVDWDEVRNA